MVDPVLNDDTTAANPTSPPRINEHGIELIKKFEGLRLNAYVCAGGRVTIGYGHTATVRFGQKITQEDADNLLQKDLRTVEQGVARLVKVALNSNQFSALVAFAFNVGVGALERSSLLQLLNRGWYEQVPAQLMRWNKANGRETQGLMARRQAEAELWSTKPES